jgi:hypothetical protein
MSSLPKPSSIQADRHVAAVTGPSSYSITSSSSASARVASRRAHCQTTSRRPILTTAPTLVEPAKSRALPRDQGCNCPASPRSPLTSRLGGDGPAAPVVGPSQFSGAHILRPGARCRHHRGQPKSPPNRTARLEPPRRAAEERYELAPVVHSITSSARASNVGET